MDDHVHINMRFNESAPEALATVRNWEEVTVEYTLLRTLLTRLGWTVGESESTALYSDLVLTWGTDAITLCAWRCECSTGEAAIRR